MATFSDATVFTMDRIYRTGQLQITGRRFLLRMPVSRISGTNGFFAEVENEVSLNVNEVLSWHDSCGVQHIPEGSTAVAMNEVRRVLRAARFPPESWFIGDGEDEVFVYCTAKKHSKEMRKVLPLTANGVTVKYRYVGTIKAGKEGKA